MKLLKTMQSLKSFRLFKHISDAYAFVRINLNSSLFEMEGARNPRKLSAAKESRLALLSRMREAKEKGEKLRIEKEEESVYVTVDESEYAKLVQQRLEDDWIVDDGARNPRKLSAAKESRLALLSRMREAKEKGEKLRIEKEEESVYVTVDESEYAKLVQQRLEDDWIVDDDGLGYADDGREIFDDNDEDEAVDDRGRRPKRSNKTQSHSKKTRLNPDIRATESAPLRPVVGRDIRSLFAASSAQNSSTKKRKEPIEATVDPNLDDLLAELECNDSVPGKSDVVPPLSRPTRPHKVKSRRTVPSQPFQSSEEDQLAEELENSDVIDVGSHREPMTKKHSTRTPVVEAKQKKPVSDVIPLPKPRVTNPFSTEKQPKPRAAPATTETVTDDTAASPEPDTVMTEMEVSVADFDDDFDVPDESSKPKPEPISQPTSDELIKAVKPDQPSISWLAAESEATKLMEDSDWNDELTTASVTADDGLHFYWFDAYEDSRHQPGVVYLFGKIKDSQRPGKFISCCLRVKDLERRIFLLPRPELTDGAESGSFMKEVYTEFRQVSAEHKVGKFRCKISWCQTDFEVSWQSGVNCPVVKLSALLERQQAEGHSSAATVPPAPPLCLVAVNVKSVTQPQANHSEIVSIGLLINRAYSLDRPVGKSLFQSHYLVMAPPKDAALPYDLRTKLPTWGKQYAPPPNSWMSNQEEAPQTSGSSVIGVGGVDIEPNERALLGRLLTRIHKLDPDILVGHDLWGHQIELLVQRLNANKVPHWHRIGRLRRSAQYSVSVNNRSWLIRNSMPGRLVCDTRVSARELVRSRTYNLSDLANQVLADVGTSGCRRQVPPYLLKVLNGVSSADDALGSIGVELADLEIDSADLRCLFATSDLVKQLIDFCLSDAHLALRLAHQLQATMQITCICGNVLSRTLSGGRAERNEALLLHAFTQHGYIVPDPPTTTRRGRGTHAAGQDDWDVVEHADETQPAALTGKRKPAYTGGLVLEPKKGFYDKYILLLDFNSLYPSIIQEFNICFTTVDRELVTGSDSNVAESTDVEAPHSEAADLDIMVASLLATVQGTAGGSTTVTDPRSHQPRLPTAQTPGLLPAEIRRLVDSRREVKKLITAASNSANPDQAQLAQWNTRQAALKLTANSVYGCLGFAASRFCARGLAALVTGLGRAVLMNTRDLVENMNFEVIYGDTDSIMVNTNSTDLLTALSIGEKVRHEVNKHYRLLELDTDGVYAAMLLLAKKKYAALAIQNPIQWAAAFKAAQAKHQPALPPPKTKQEMKGLDIVRRDWSAIAVSVGRRCVAALLSGEPKDVILERIHTDLIETAEKVREGKMPLSDFIITKMLTKAPEDYADAKSQPHVQVALRLNNSVGSNDGGARRRLRAGDTVEYIICNDGSGSVATQRGYSPGELTNRGVSKSADDQQPSLTVDVNYYLAHQIHPVVSRLVAPIEGTSPARIADCLGLDPSGYRRQAVDVAGGDEDENIDCTVGSNAGVTAWGDVEPLYLPCPQTCGGPQLEIKPSGLTALSKAWVACSDPQLDQPNGVFSRTDQFAHSVPSSAGGSDFPRTDYVVEALMNSPWVQQYRSKCAEMGRGFVCHETFRPSSSRAVRFPSMGRKLATFLRGAFKKPPENSIPNGCRSPCFRTELIGNISAKDPPKPHRYTPSEPQTGRKKTDFGSSRPVTTMSKRHKSSHLLSIRHSGNRSVDQFTKCTVSSVNQSRACSSVPLDQCNSQNSTPTPRPSALITDRPQSEKSREGTAKRTRFSLHPSTCNAPPDLIRPRRDSEDTAASISSTVNPSSKSGELHSSTMRVDKSTPSIGSNTKAVSKSQMGNSSLRTGTDSCLLAKSVSLKSSLKQQTNPPGSVTAATVFEPNSSAALLDPPTHDSLPFRGVTSTTNQKTCSGQTRRVHTPIVMVTPTRSKQTCHASSQPVTGKSAERKHVSFEVDGYHSLPASPLLHSTPRPSPQTPDQAEGESHLSPIERATDQRSTSSFGRGVIARPSRPRSRRCSTFPTALHVHHCVRHSIPPRFRRYRKLIADLNQIYRNYAAPYEITREIVDETCQRQLATIVKAMFRSPDVFDARRVSARKCRRETWKRWYARTKQVDSDITRNEMAVTSPKSTYGLTQSESPKSNLSPSDRFPSEILSVDEPIKTEECIPPANSKRSYENLDIIPTKDVQSARVRCTSVVERQIQTTDVFTSRLLSLDSKSPSSIPVESLSDSQLTTFDTPVSLEQKETLNLAPEVFSMGDAQPYPSRVHGNEGYSKAETPRIITPVLCLSEQGSCCNENKTTKSTTVSSERDETDQLMLLQCRRDITSGDYATARSVFHSPIPTNVESPHAGVSSFLTEPVVVQTSVSPVSVDQSGSKSQFCSVQPLGQSCLWNLIPHSVLEIPSISEGSGKNKSQETQVSDGQLLACSQSSTLKSAVVDSLSVCLSKLGVTHTEVNTDVTGLSECSLSPLSTTEDGSHIPWTRAKIVVLRDPAQTVDQGNPTATALLFRCHVSDAAVQTDPVGDGELSSLSLSTLPTMPSQNFGPDINGACSSPMHPEFDALFANTGPSRLDPNKKYSTQVGVQTECASDGESGSVQLITSSSIIPDDNVITAVMTDSHRDFWNQSVPLDKPSRATPHNCLLRIPEDDRSFRKRSFIKKAGISPQHDRVKLRGRLRPISQNSKSSYADSSEVDCVTEYGLAEDHPYSRRTKHSSSVVARRTTFTKDVDASSGDNIRIRIPPGRNVDPLLRSRQFCRGKQKRTFTYPSKDTDASDADASSSLSSPTDLYSSLNNDSKQGCYKSELTQSQTVRRRSSACSQDGISASVEFCGIPTRKSSVSHQCHTPLHSITSSSSLKRHSSVPQISRYPSTRSSWAPVTPFQNPFTSVDKMRTRSLARLHHSRADTTSRTSMSGATVQKSKSWRSTSTLSDNCGYVRRSGSSLSSTGLQPKPCHHQFVDHSSTSIQQRRKNPSSCRKFSNPPRTIANTVDGGLRNGHFVKQRRVGLSHTQPLLPVSVGWHRMAPILTSPLGRSVDDSLLRHTFASLQKVRSKVSLQTIGPNRPPMVFKR
ncbi:hypothetical protein T265_05525 [Opisthorchis viverrini]|uniref:DNA-directed DNA polymerase n=1 Tax=Opisthorchis viverrini TaxID=6198 RepID=A0A074ZJA5_OPIVI|nr:hypothetical protein T265_05525 [Opisthorchis viverrini]KER27418.1 hypothetical protein T265_05525 [Opisthorchis viverrini]